MHADLDALLAVLYVLVDDLLPRGQRRRGQRPRISDSDLSDAHGGHSKALAAVLALTTAYTLAEVVGGLLTGNLALLADAGHMLSDDMSLGLALVAIWLARRPATPERSFGLNVRRSSPRSQTA